MTWTTDQILSGLYILVAVMLIVALYHAIFIVVDARKVMKRAERVSEQLEGVIMKPLSMTDKAFEWLIAHIEQIGQGHDKKKR